MPNSINNINMQNRNTPTPEEIQQQTEILKANMTELNNTLVQLARNQQTLGENIKESADGFKDIAKAADTATECPLLWN